jgi:hypothetical protein
MDILDGRRAVPGDMVECVFKGPQWEGDDGRLTVFGPKTGERTLVKYVKFKQGDIYLVFEEYDATKNMYLAECFRIVPDDKKADTNIAFETKYATWGT